MQYQAPIIHDVSHLVITFRTYGSGSDMMLRDLSGLWSIQFDAASRQWAAKYDFIENIQVYASHDLTTVLDEVRIATSAAKYLVKGGPETEN